MYVNPKEALMNSARRVIAVLVAVLALGVAPVAYAAVDYSQNAAGGDYAPAVTTEADTPVDYSQNAAGGGYAPAVTTPADTPVASSGSDFDWGAAALGAGAALVLVLLVTGVRSGLGTVRSRREAA
jgi:hypothetical protein